MTDDGGCDPARGAIFAPMGADDGDPPGAARPYLEFALARNHAKRTGECATRPMVAEDRVSIHNDHQ